MKHETVVNEIIIELLPWMDPQALRELLVVESQEPNIAAFHQTHQKIPDPQESDVQDQSLQALVRSYHPWEYCPVWYLHA